MPSWWASGVVIQHIRDIRKDPGSVFPSALALMGFTSSQGRRLVSCQPSWLHMKERVAFSEGEKVFPGCLLQILPPEPEEGSCQSTYSRKKMLGSASWDGNWGERNTEENWGSVEASLVAQMVKHLLAMWETWVRFLGRDPLEKEMAPHSSTLAWKIPWTEEPGRLQSMGSQRVGHDWETSLWGGRRGGRLIILALFIILILF